MALCERIYSYAKAFGFDELITYDKHQDKYYETAAFEEQGVHEVLNAYDAYVKAQEG